MFQQAALEKLEDYFTPLAQRPRRCVYFYRLAGLTPGSSAFLSRYYQAARENGVILDGRLANPGPDQLAYYTEMMGTEFRLDRGPKPCPLAPPYVPRPAGAGHGGNFFYLK